MKRGLEGTLLLGGALIFVGYVIFSLSQEYSFSRSGATLIPGRIVVPDAVEGGGEFEEVMTLKPPRLEAFEGAVDYGIEQSDLSDQLNMSHPPSSSLVASNQYLVLEDYTPLVGAVLSIGDSLSDAATNPHGELARTGQDGRIWMERTQLGSAKAGVAVITEWGDGVVGGLVFVKGQVARALEGEPSILVAKATAVRIDCSRIVPVGVAPKLSLTVRVAAEGAMPVDLTRIITSSHDGELLFLLPVRSHVDAYDSTELGVFYSGVLPDVSCTDIALEPRENLNRGSLQVQLVFRNSSPPTGARLCIGSASGSSAVRNVGRDGTAVFSDIPPGEYTMTLDRIPFARKPVLGNGWGEGRHGDFVRQVRICAGEVTQISVSEPIGHEVSVLVSLDALLVSELVLPDVGVRQGDFVGISIVDSAGRESELWFRHSLGGEYSGQGDGRKLALGIETEVGTMLGSDEYDFWASILGQKVHLGRRVVGIDGQVIQF